MEGFKANPKMRSDLPCFKEGGYVTKKELVAYEKKEDRAEEKKDIAEDKKIAKKAIAQHESAQHKGEPKTEIKLRKGGRCKKEGGVVNRFKTGGVVESDGKSKKEDPIKKVKEGSKKASAPSKAATKEKTPKAKNYAAGSWVNEEPDDATAVVKRPPVMVKRRRPVAVPPRGAMPGQGPISDIERQRLMEMFQGGPQGQMPAPQAPAYAPGGSVTDPIMRPGRAGLGTALNTGALGAAGPMGAPRNTPITPQEADVLRGLEAVGSYCGGGKAYK